MPGRQLVIWFQMELFDRLAPTGRGTAPRPVATQGEGREPRVTTGAGGAPARAHGTTGPGLAKCWDGNV